jgi:hypothetical protein
MKPAGVPAAPPLGGRRRHPRIALQPRPHDVLVELLRPQRPGQRLAHDAAFVFGQVVRHDCRVEPIGLVAAPVEDGAELVVQAGTRGDAIRP